MASRSVNTVSEGLYQLQRLLAEMQLFTDAGPHQPWLIEMMTAVMTKNQEINQASTAPGLPPTGPPVPGGAGIAGLIAPPPAAPPAPMRGLVTRPPAPNADELARLLGPGNSARGRVASPMPVMPPMPPVG